MSFVFFLMFLDFTRGQRAAMTPHRRWQLLTDSKRKKAWAHFFTLLTTNMFRFLWGVREGAQVCALEVGIGSLPQ